jgi:hypothetical protein
MVAEELEELNLFSSETTFRLMLAIDANAMPLGWSRPQQTPTRPDLMALAATAVDRFRPQAASAAPDLG